MPKDPKIMLSFLTNFIKIFVITFIDLNNQPPYLEFKKRYSEALSAKQENIEAINKLKDNVIKLSVINQTTLLNKKIENISFLDDEEKYDILFFDPPYADKKFVQNLFSLKKSKIFKKKHLIIIHRERNSEDNYENIIDLIILKKYGRSKIIFGSFI